ncbi:hypothetical protein EGR_01225 [Echinococcus granulosus]|uniref:Uncharacterized protein n=1 Tax=Echinococcus granulosus TaxID=6210 RepID=W6UZW3_ECHGR|nr:hypothetical protein EGR_01225 [Echinococcus granulosus]EUB64097.1 hypothetical protein EGR_01225 [Echinococcus granulosus]
MPPSDGDNCNAASMERLVAYTRRAGMEAAAGAIEDGAVPWRKLRECQRDLKADIMDWHMQINNANASVLENTTTSAAGFIFGNLRMKPSSANKSTNASNRTTPYDKDIYKLYRRKVYRRQGYTRVPAKFPKQMHGSNPLYVRYLPR